MEKGKETTLERVSTLEILFTK